MSLYAERAADNRGLRTKREDYYDIVFSDYGVRSSGNAKKGKAFLLGPRRTASSNNLDHSSDVKRPGDYYIQKINKSSQSLMGLNEGSHGRANNAAQNRPRSNESVLSIRTAFSDDVSLLESSNFDVPDSRLSSLTSRSIGSPLNSSFNSLQNNSQTLKLDNIIKEEIGSDDVEDSSFDRSESTDYGGSFRTSESLGSSRDTLTYLQHGSESVASLSYETPSLARSRPAVRAMSTGNIKSKSMPTIRNCSSSVSLTRTKSRYMDRKEAKERLQLRKKTYEENDHDDVILDSESDYVFNVPVMKSQTDFYLNNISSDFFGNQGGARKGLSSKSVPEITPCPLPGKLGRRLSKGVLDSEDSIIEEEEELTLEADSTVSRNISDFYSQRTESLINLLKEKRKQEVLYKVPSFVKSQSSLNELPFLSNEKISVMDQTRPIHLPPKNENDRTKHNREFQKVLTSFESNSKNFNATRSRRSADLIASGDEWCNIIVLEDSDFARKINKDKNMLRKLAWESLCPQKACFEFFYKILAINNSSVVSQIKETYKSSCKKVSHLSESVRSSKESEFSTVIKTISGKPLFESMIKEFKEKQNTTFSQVEFENKYKKLLLIKSLSTHELRKHDEIFLIPYLTLLLPESRTEDIYLLSELINYNVLDSDLTNEITDALKKWMNTSNFSSSSYLYKFLKLSEPEEFKRLNINNFFEILLHFNDKLPLSLSAPSTPIMAQSAQFSSFSLAMETNGESSQPNEPGMHLASLFDSATFNLSLKFLQLITIYSSSRDTRIKNTKKVFQSFLIVVFKYYHINWNNYMELIKENKSIRLNNSADNLVNLDSFVSKWSQLFRVI